MKYKSKIDLHHKCNLIFYDDEKLIQKKTAKSNSSLIIVITIQFSIFSKSCITWKQKKNVYSKNSSTNKIIRS